MTEYDVVFVGAGIANMYCARQYLKKKPDAKIVILEKSQRAGGRIAWSRFCGIEVVKGAGVGRYQKDTLLMSLLKELDVKYKIYHGKQEDNSLANVIKRLKARKGETFKPLKV